MGIIPMNIKAGTAKKNDTSKVEDSRFDIIAKRIFDIAFSVLVIFTTWPVLVVIAVLVKLSSKGPVLFKQKRNGLFGDSFYIYKFRSMKIHEEKEGEVTQARKNDERITKIGAFLRRTSLDELPQFFNVLIGDMSVVGPRPHAIEHDEYYKKIIGNYSRRYEVKPGLTGLAQVCGYRGETDTLEKMESRVALDLVYVEKRTLLMDLNILIKTPLALLSNEAY